MTEAIRVLTADQLVAAEGTPGLDRRVAFEGDGHWFGHVDAAPETMSGWHHHGDNATFGYVLSGRISLEFGPGGREAVDVNEGEYFFVPEQMVHREGNATAEGAQVVLVRVGDGPPVFPADGPDPG